MRNPEAAGAGGLADLMAKRGQAFATARESAELLARLLAGAPPEE